MVESTVSPELYFLMILMGGVAGYHADFVKTKMATALAALVSPLALQVIPKVSKVLLLSSRDAGNVPEADDDWSDEIQPVLTSDDYSFNRIKMRGHIAFMKWLIESPSVNATPLEERYIFQQQGLFFIFDCYRWLFYPGGDFIRFVRLISMTNDRDMWDLFRTTNRLCEILGEQRLFLRDANIDDDD